MKDTKRSRNQNGLLDRRTFLQGMIAAGGFAAMPSSGVFGAVSRLGQALPSTKVNIAIVGIGNRGGDIMRALNGTGLVNIVALCDTEMGAKHTERALKEFPSVPQFTDFRKMFDKMGKEFDAVCVGTPDHSHFPVTMLAMSQKKHVFLEKPMAHSFHQTELMMRAEKKHKVVCQMGNQGHSGANYFQMKAWVEAGIIRNVKEITVFMNSARRWHGLNITDFLPQQPMPETLDWDSWTATARELSFNNGYLNGDWRAWYEFGNGALGDWGAHLFDTAHEFLELGLPTLVDPELIEGHNAFIFPQASTVAFHFPKRGSMPPVKLTWYDGVKNLPPLPPGFDGSVVDPNIPPPSKGVIDTKTLAPGRILYGEGLTFKGGSHATPLEIIPKDAARDLKLPEVPPSPSNHFLNFVRACKGEETCRSHFGVSGPLCQAMALGVIAQRVNAKLEFDPKRKRITNHKLANELLKGAPPRKGWEEFYKL